MHLAHYLGLLHQAQWNSPTPSARSATHTTTSPTSPPRATGSRATATTTPKRSHPFVDRYGEDADDEPDRLHSELFRAPAPAASPCCATSTTST